LYKIFNGVICIDLQVIGCWSVTVFTKKNVISNYCCQKNQTPRAVTGTPGHQSQETSGQLSFLQPSGSDTPMLPRGDSYPCRSPHSADFVRLPNISHMLQPLDKTNDTSQKSVIGQQMNTARNIPLLNQPLLRMEQSQSLTETPIMLQNPFQPSADPVWVKNPDPIPVPHEQRQKPQEDPNHIENESSSSNPNYGSEDTFLSSSGTLPRINEQANQQLFQLSSSDESLHHPLSIPFHQTHLNVNKLKLEATSPKSKSSLSASGRHHPYAASPSHSEQGVRCYSKSVPLQDREGSEDFEYTQPGENERKYLDQGSSHSTVSSGKNVKNKT